MSSEESASTASRGGAQRGVGERLRIIGPGLVLAATTVGIGDFISNAVAGEHYGMTFAWAIVLAVVLKYFLTEGLGGGTWRRARRSSTAGTLSDEG